VHRHVLPALGRIGQRRLRHHHIEALYDQLLTPSNERPALAPKTVYEVHLVIRGALDEAVRRGLVTRNVALIARSPRLKAIQKTEAHSWNAERCSGSCGPRPDIGSSRCCGWRQ
jgi:integrase